MPSIFHATETVLLFVEMFKKVLKEENEKKKTNIPQSGRVGRIFYFCFLFGNRKNGWHLNLGSIQFLNSFSFPKTFFTFSLFEFGLEPCRISSDNRRQTLHNSSWWHFNVIVRFFPFVPTITSMVFFVISEFLAYDNLQYVINILYIFIVSLDIIYLLYYISNK